MHAFSLTHSWTRAKPHRAASMAADSSPVTTRNHGSKLSSVKSMSLNKSVSFHFPSIFWILIKHPYVSSTPLVFSPLFLIRWTTGGKTHTSRVCVQLHRCVCDWGGVVGDNSVSQCFSAPVSVSLQMVFFVCVTSLLSCFLVCVGMVSPFFFLRTGRVTPQIWKVLLFYTLNLMLAALHLFSGNCLIVATGLRDHQHAYYISRSALFAAEKWTWKWLRKMTVCLFWFLCEVKLNQNLLTKCGDIMSQTLQKRKKKKKEP